MAALTEEQLRWALSNRASVLKDLDKFETKQSLVDFIKLSWKHLEPAQKLVDGWAMHAICEHLEAVSNGQIKRLLINVPPGCMKSMTTSVFWPVWEWGPRERPDLRYINASYHQGLATRDLVRGRDLIMAEWFQERWPIQLKMDQNLKTYYENTKHGWRFASSVGGSLTGYRGDRIVIDDPHDVKAAESDAHREEALRWFTEVVPTRLNNQSESVIVVIMQRLHERDVSGLILGELLSDWEHLMLPMELEQKHRCWSIVPSGFGSPEFMKREKKEVDILPCYIPDLKGEKRWPADPRTKEGELLWPDRFNAESVETLKRVFRSKGGSYAEAAQLQQRPAPRGGGMFKRDDFQFMDRAPEGGVWVRGWDLAATEDSQAAWTSGAKLGLVGGKLVIADMRRGQLSPYQSEELISSTARSDGYSVFISLPQDPGQAGKAQKRWLAAGLHGYQVHFSRETGSKENRAAPFAAQVEAGNVFLVRAPWNDALLAEAQLFPASRFKDQIDSLSRAYAFLLAQGEDPQVSITPGKAFT